MDEELDWEFMSDRVVRDFPWYRQTTHPSKEFDEVYIDIANVPEPQIQQVPLEPTEEVLRMPEMPPSFSSVFLSGEGLFRQAKYELQNRDPSWFPPGKDFETLTPSPEVSANPLFKQIVDLFCAACSIDPTPKVSPNSIDPVRKALNMPSVALFRTYVGDNLHWNFEDFLLLCSGWGQDLARLMKLCGSGADGMRGNCMLMDAALKNPDLMAKAQSVAGLCPQLQKTFVPMNLSSYLKSEMIASGFRSCTECTPNFGKGIWELCPLCQASFVLCYFGESGSRRPRFKHIMASHGIHYVISDETERKCLVFLMKNLCHKDVQVLGTFFDVVTFDEDRPSDLGIQILGGGVTPNGVEYRTTMIGNDSVFCDPIVHTCDVVDFFSANGIESLIQPSRLFTQSIGHRYLNEKLKTYASNRAATFMKVVRLTLRHQYCDPELNDLTRKLPWPPSPPKTVEDVRRSSHVYLLTPEEEMTLVAGRVFTTIDGIDWTPAEKAQHIKWSEIVKRTVPNKGEILGVSHLTHFNLQRFVVGAKWDGQRAMVAFTPDGMYVCLDHNGRTSVYYGPPDFDYHMDTVVVCQAEYISVLSAEEMAAFETPNLILKGHLIITDVLRAGPSITTVHQFWKRWTDGQRLTRGCAASSLANGISWTQWSPPQEFEGAPLVDHEAALSFFGNGVPFDGVVFQSVDAPGILLNGRGSALYVKYNLTVDVVDPRDNTRVISVAVGRPVQESIALNEAKIRTDKTVPNSARDLKLLETSMTPAQIAHLIRERYSDSPEHRILDIPDLDALGAQALSESLLPDGKYCIDKFRDVVKRVLVNIGYDHPDIIMRIRGVGSPMWPWLFFEYDNHKEREESLGHSIESNLFKDILMVFPDRKVPVGVRDKGIVFVAGRLSKPAPVLVAFALTACLYEESRALLSHGTIAMMVAGTCGRRWLEEGRVVGSYDVTALYHALGLTDAYPAPPEIYEQGVDDVPDADALNALFVA